MKTRKSILVLVLVVILLLGSVLVSSAENKIMLTGGANNSFFGLGWEWMGYNVTLDPSAPLTDNADGKVRYKVYEYDENNQKPWGSWGGEPVCGALGEFNGAPTIALVIKVTEVKNIDPYWIGKYMKVTVSDGGQNASEDTIGILVFDYDTMSPVDYIPSCEYEVPGPYSWYPSQKGNLTIHD